MGALGGLTGLAGGASGSGFAMPSQADIQRGVNPDQLNAAAKGNQEALAQQQGLLAALNRQNGLENQSSVFNQLQGVANGTGPNPAKAMLNQQTGANVANQAALMAGQRGAGANVGLMARQAGQQGGALQQQAVGQGATMQANQSMNALGQLGGIANTQVANQIGATNAYTAAQQAGQANLLNALQGQNSAQVGSQGSVNAANAGLANTQMQGQQAMIGGGMNALGGGGGKAMMGGAHGGRVPGYDEGGAIPTPDGSAPPVGPTPPGAPTGLGSLSAMTPTAPGAATGLGSLPPAQPAPMPQGPQSSFGQFISKVDSGGPAQSTPIQMGPDSGAQALYEGASSMFGGGGSSSGGGGGGGGMASMLPMLMALSQGGLVDVMVSPGEKIIPPNKVKKAAEGKVEAKTVPGKPKVPGDSTENDTVKTKLAPGTIVVKRTKAKNDKDAGNFVRSVLAKRGRK